MGPGGPNEKAGPPRDPTGPNGRTPNHPPTRNQTLAKNAETLFSIRLFLRIKKVPTDDKRFLILVNALKAMPQVRAIKS